MPQTVFGTPPPGQGPITLELNPRSGPQAVPVPQPPAQAPPESAPFVADDAPIPDAIWASLGRHQLLLPFLRQRVIAGAVSPVQISQAERNEAVKAWAGQHGISSQDALVAHCQRHGLSEADLIWQAELPLRIVRHGEEHFSHRAENRFLARKNQLDQVIYSLLRVEDGALARELYLRIAEGEADFAELAARYALGPERSTRGVVGPVPLLQAHPTLAELLRTSRVGQLHPPLAIEQWWLVVRLETLHPATFDEEMRRRMTRELFEAWVDEEVARLLKERGQTATTAPQP